jgi:cobalt-zinc-cadmium resistance protein CzcA
MIIERVLRFAILQRWTVVLAAVGIALVGSCQLARLPIDAVPDITTVQVQINTTVEGMSPIEVERRITFTIETAMAGLPALSETRSLSRYGLSQVTVVFRDGTDIYFARQLVNERLQEARATLPDEASPSMGPIATGLGEIFMWTVEAEPGARHADGREITATDLREVQDWVVRPQLRTVEGVTDVNTIGGYRRQYHVTPDPTRLIALGLTLRDVELALALNNSNAGGGYIAHKGEQYLVTATGRIANPSEIGRVVVATRNGMPIHVDDVAQIGEGRELRTGAATENGREVVLGTAFMLVGENSRTVAQRLARRLAEIDRTLPEGITARVIYDRTKLVDATLHTVRTNLLEGAALVIAVLFLLLGNLTGAVIVACIIPLSMLFAASGMVAGRISANLLSLGAIDFGIIVDGAVVMVENILRRLAIRQHERGRTLTLQERLHECLASGVEVGRPTLFAVAIIMFVYLPVLTLSGIEGKMFRPMAQVVLLALGGALLLSFTLVPALAALLLRGRVSERESLAVRWSRSAYLPALRWALARRMPVLAGATLLVVVCGLLASRMGSEFVPTLDERDIAIHALRIPGTSLEQAVAMQGSVEQALGAFPEVERVFSKIGTAEIANDPMPPSVSDVFVMLKPPRAWPDPRRPKADLVAAMERRLDLLPGNVYEYTQPIQMRFNELIAGVRADVALKVFGDDLDVLLAAANRAAAMLRAIPGAADVKVEQVSGLPILTIEVQRQATARYGLNVSDVQAVIRTALAGSVAGEVFEGDRRFEIVVRLPEHVRNDLRALELLPVPVVAAPHSLVPGALPAAHSKEATEFIPLGAVATIRLEEGPNQVSRENGKRRVVVQANVRGRDIGGFVRDARAAVARQVALPPGNWLVWGGQFEHMVAARTRLMFVVPLALLLIFLLLFGAFGSIMDALLVFSGVPLALTGGVLALVVRGLPFSITAGVGFIALSGVAVLNGVVLLSFIRQLRAEGRSVDEALVEGCTTRLRPVLMTALVASLGFVPMAVASGTGAEVQHPLATVVIGGVVSSTLLTLLVLPVLYRLAHRDREGELRI